FIAPSLGASGVRSQRTPCAPDSTAVVTARSLSGGDSRDRLAGVRAENHLAAILVIRAETDRRVAPKDQVRVAAVLADGGTERGISLACLLAGGLRGVVAVVAVPSSTNPSRSSRRQRQPPPPQRDVQEHLGLPLESVAFQRQQHMALCSDFLWALEPVTPSL